ncbi:MAG: response regulator [Chitinophagales bacterium]|nr:response regulator [Chitinophagales bacterium]
MMSERKQILTVEDDTSVRMLLEYLLRGSYNVRVQKDGMEGMVWLENGNTPDLILLDTEMPRLNGFEFLKNIKKSGYYRDIPVIMLVGTENSDNIINFLHQGATDILMKPFNPKDLFDKIDTILNNKN